MPPSTPLRILVVENHENTLLHLSRYISMCGHEVHTARTVKDAQATFVAMAPEVLISDIHLPDGNGWELMKELKQCGKPIYGIAMSGFGSASDREQSLAAGYSHHLGKPLQPDLLDSVLEEAGAFLANPTTASAE